MRSLVSCGWFRYNMSGVFASNSPTLSMSSTAIGRDYSNSCMILVNEGIINPRGISIYKHLWLFPRNEPKGIFTYSTVYHSLPIPFNITKLNWQQKWDDLQLQSWILHRLELFQIFLKLLCGGLKDWAGKGQLVVEKGSIFWSSSCVFFWNSTLLQMRVQTPLMYSYTFKLDKWAAFASFSSLGVPSWMLVHQHPPRKECIVSGWFAWTKWTTRTKTTKTVPKFKW